MVSIGSLWLAILLSAVLVFIASSIVWMVLPYHFKDFSGLSDEEAARNALRGHPVGQYNIPHCESRAHWTSDEFKKKVAEGPAAFVTVVPANAMGKQLSLWFIYTLLVGAAVAYIATRTLAADAAYLKVFQICGTVAWLAYGFGSILESIWFGKTWSNTVKALFDGLIYATLTAGVFAWLWG